MPDDPNLPVPTQDHVQAPHYTRTEIFNQPRLWPTTLDNTRSAAHRLHLQERLANARVLLTGAGTSAYAAAAIASAWPGALAVPTTDLLVDLQRYLPEIDVVISLARSGDSPESSAVSERIRAVQPGILQLAILCNKDGALSRAGIDGFIALDPRTNDRGLVMTSSFSNLVLAGLVLAQPDAAAAAVPMLSERGAALLPEIDEACRRIAARLNDRLVVLSSSPSLAWGRESALKTLEITAGRLAVVSETFLGLRHGPMSFIKPDTVVLCLLSNDPVRRAYEIDLIDELRAKNIGYMAGIANPAESQGLFEDLIPAVAPQTDDALRTPFEIMGPQLLAYHSSLRLGLNPDNPSPDGIINRVVQGFRIHPLSPCGAGSFTR